MTPTLTASILETLVDLWSTIAAVEQRLGDIARGTTHQPGRTSLHLPSSDTRYLVMSGLADARTLTAVKLLLVLPTHVTARLPTERSSILHADQYTGETLALLDGRVPTRMRTAAASAVASKYLARPASSTHGLLGAGALAIAHVKVMLQVRSIDTVVLWFHSAAVESFSAKTAHNSVNASSASTIQEVVKSADVLCALTPSVEPLGRGKWFRPGLHINAVGARPRPIHREIDSAGMGSSQVFVDSMETAVEKPGDMTKPQSRSETSAENSERSSPASRRGAASTRTSRCLIPWASACSTWPSATCCSIPPSATTTDPTSTWHSEETNRA